jgi:ribosomal protein S18 acetylase RimI-like enzyme
MTSKERGKENIRHMTRSDIHNVLALDRKFAGTRGHLSYKDLVALDPGGPLDVSFVAEVEGNIIGFVMARLTYLMIPFTEVCMLQGILVDPEYQNRGIGSKLFRELLGYCQAEGINTVRTLVEEHNDELRRFVERLGFRRSAIINYDRTYES